jgi:hypothetical protein
MNSKQVLVMKKFPTLRVGKYVSQGCHASVGAIFSLGKIDSDNLVIPLSNPFVKDWVLGSCKNLPPVGHTVRPRACRLTK